MPCGISLVMIPRRNYALTLGRLATLIVFSWLVNRLLSGLIP